MKWSARHPSLLFPLCCLLAAGGVGLSSYGGAHEQPDSASLPVSPLERRARQVHPTCPDGTELVVKWFMGDVTPAPFVLACTRLNGERHGPAAEWLDSGTRTGAGAYRDGVKEGMWEAFDVQGARIREAHYRRGQRSGPTRAWQADGALSSEGAHVEGIWYETWSAEHPDTPRKSVVAAVVEGLRKMLTEDGLLLGFSAGPAPDAPQVRLSTIQQHDLQELLRAALLERDAQPSPGLALTPPPWEVALVIRRAGTAPLFRVVLHPVGTGSLRMNVHDPWSTAVADEAGELSPDVVDLPIGAELFVLLEDILGPTKVKQYQRLPAHPDE